MSWFKLDDQFFSHPKVLRAGPDATLLYISGGCYAAKHLTDGLIPKCAVPTLTTLTRPQKLADQLVHVGLWHELSDDYEMHDYLRYNPSRHEIESRREAAAERAGKGGRRSAELRAKDSRDDASPDPTRPEIATQSSGARKRGTRIPDEFVVDDEMREWVERRCPRTNWRHHTERFVNHWKSESRASAVKLDWVKAWRNWMLKEEGG